MTNKTVLFVVIAASASAVGAYFWVKKNNKAMAARLAPDPPDLTSSYTPSLITDAGFPLKEGSTGANVLQLQKDLGMSASEQDGDFGPITLAALISKTGKTSVATAADLDDLTTKATSDASDTARKSLAQTLTRSAMAAGAVLEPNKNLQVYLAKKFLGLFVDTSVRLTTAPYDYDAFTPQPNVSITQVDEYGFLVMYDSSKKKYFYSSPYDWQLS